ncbi:hypothetical protein [Acetobacter sp. P5B1]|uniref:hypothetical protein n=1 Tax=Acetobacter sp. P5B1 TaxID=2762620 RepID=UPI001C04946D|nr:hypothetical protein [Acetobacter sp. P5B1]
MTFLLVLALWSAAFWCHECLQPRTRSSFPRQAGAVSVNQIVRGLAPCLALTLCLFQDPALGIFYWLGLGSAAGLGTSVLMAVLKQKRGLARVSETPL